MIKIDKNNYTSALDVIEENIGYIYHRSHLSENDIYEYAFYINKLVKIKNIKGTPFCKVTFDKNLEPFPQIKRYRPHH